MSDRARNSKGVTFFGFNAKLAGLLIHEFSFIKANSELALISSYCKTYNLVWKSKYSATNSSFLVELLVSTLKLT